MSREDQERIVAEPAPVAAVARQARGGRRSYASPKLVRQGSIATLTRIDSSSEPSDPGFLGSVPGT